MTDVGETQTSAASLGPLVSVVIPTYNRAHLLADALQSVAAQTWRPLEVIVVDDGSTDDTRAVFDRWAAGSGPDITARFEEQEHQGGNAARNLGISKAQGDFVAFLDSDDLWKPSKIARQIEGLIARRDAGASYCGIEEVEIGSDAAPYNPTRPYPEGDISKLLLVSDVTAPTSCYVVARSVLEAAGGFDEALRARQDWDLWIRVSLATQILAVPEALTVLRNHSGPRTISDPQRELTAHQAILAKYASQRKQAGRRVERGAMSAFHRRAGRVNFHHIKNTKAAVGHYLRAIWWSPLTMNNYFALVGTVLPAQGRKRLNRAWNAVFGRTGLRISSH
ncbi:MAG: glycosyltransferase family A protein [Pseudomonadota bacterium]